MGGVSRVLVVSADIGAGHDLPARLLADAIAAAEPGAQVTVVDGLEAMGRLARAIARSGAETILQHGRPLFELQYWLIARFGPTRRLGGVIGLLIGGRGLLRLIARTRPDVVVSTYPGTTEIIARLRAAGRIAVPCVSAVTDLAALRWWAHPAIDRHLVIHEESRAEVLAVAGPDADVRHVRGLVRPEYDAPPSREEAREALGLPASGPVIAVSGGGWGMGDVERAVGVSRAVPGATVVCLCGSNAGLRARLERAFAGDGLVRVEGFTERMCEWLAAADVLVHSPAGLTMREAELCGTWAVSYGWGVAHVRLNNAAYRRFGLAAVASSPAELSAALREALRAPRARDAAHAALPTAADAVLELTGRARAGAGVA
jgi:UDP-N-acetylglucosamine:LPS N-acetylglucosamine transferase